MFVFIHKSTDNEIIVCDIGDNRQQKIQTILEQFFYTDDLKPLRTFRQCKTVLNFTWQTTKFFNCHHTTVHRILWKPEVLKISIIIKTIYKSKDIITVD